MIATTILRLQRRGSDRGAALFNGQGTKSGARKCATIKENCR